MPTLRSYASSDRSIHRRERLAPTILADLTLAPLQPFGATLIELYEQQVNESRRMNANLERIAASLEKLAKA